MSSWYRSPLFLLVHTQLSPSRSCSWFLRAFIFSPPAWAGLPRWQWATSEPSPTHHPLRQRSSASLSLIACNDNHFGSAEWGWISCLAIAAGPEEVTCKCALLPCALQPCAYIRVRVSRSSGFGSGPTQASSRDGEPTTVRGSSLRKNSGAGTTFMV